MKCPKCGSKDVRLYMYMGAKVLKCKKCGFDESASLDAFAEQRKSQKAKGGYSVYKTGGSRRTIK